MSFKVAAFYKFARLPHCQTLQPLLLAAMHRHDIRGIIVMAHEGLNGTIAGQDSAVDAALREVHDITGLTDVDVKYSLSAEMPFKRIKVRLKQEIVTIGDVAADPTETVGTYVEPSEWNALISDPDVILLDTRNNFEVGIGTFAGAINPQTESFSDFPDFVREKLEANKSARIAMFCTGGIRCEKASSFMKKEGFENVFHLKGGILKYLEVVPEKESRWSGACFVFDERVAVEQGLKVSDFTMCHGCTHPVSAQDRKSEKYEKGVCCPHCADSLTPEQFASNRERQRQVELAKQTGLRHLGPVA